MSSEAKGNGKRILVVEHHQPTRERAAQTLRAQSYEVQECANVHDVDELVSTLRPHLLLVDTMLPGRNGLDLCRSLQENPETAAIPVVITSVKQFEADKKAALLAGASGYLIKPYSDSALLEIVDHTLGRHFGVTIWGCRGSIASPDRASGYGGNTTCIDVTLPGQRHVVFDAGTGIRLLGNALIGHSPLRLAIMFTHYHWDHTQGLPFFKPLYVPGNEIHLYGPEDKDSAMSATLAGVMGGKFFPVSIEAFRASVRYNAVQETQVPFDMFGIAVTTLEVVHPGTTLAYRLEYGGRSVVFCPDNELEPSSCGPELSGQALRMAEFAEGASLLIHDCQYSFEQYQSKRGWGHSCGMALGAVAAHARPERVLLFHHDPDADDCDVDAIHGEFRRELEARGAGSVSSSAACEGETILL